MAYHYTSGSVANTGQLLKKLKEFMVDTVGWTLHDTNITNWDNPSTGQWAVFYSDGESGRETLYYRLYYYSSDRIRVYGYLYWNASNHTGKREFHNSDETAIWGQSSSFLYWFYGSKDCIITITKDDYRFMYFGLIDTLYNSEIALVQENVEAGSNRIIKLDKITDDMQVGRHIIIWDNNNMDRCKVVAVQESPNAQITVESLGHNYNVNSKVNCQNGYIVANYRFYSGSKGLFDGWNWNYNCDRCCSVGGRAPFDCTEFLYRTDPECFNYARIISDIWITNSTRSMLVGKFKYIVAAGRDVCENRELMTDGINTYRFFRPYGCCEKIGILEV